MAKDILSIAAAIKDIYENIYDVSLKENELTEMKMHKLLYFAQKRHYMNFGEWLFNEDFEGWVHGPVNREVRRNFMFLPKDYEELTLEEEYTIREVVFDYGKLSAYDLRELSHKDEAYKISRIGLGADERGDRPIFKENIIKDIINEQRME